MVLFILPVVAIGLTIPGIVCGFRAFQSWETVSGIMVDPVRADSVRDKLRLCFANPWAIVLEFERASGPLLTVLVALGRARGRLGRHSIRSGKLSSVRGGGIEVLRAL